MESHRPYTHQQISTRDPTSPSVQQRASGARGHGNPFSSKVNGVLATSYADSEFREVLSMVDERGLENSSELRRQIRLQLQKEVIESNGEIIREFGHVAEQLRRVGAILEGLTQTYSHMKSELDTAHQDTTPILKESSLLMKRRGEVEGKADVLRRLRGHFVLSSEEVNRLTLPSEPIDDHFFATLSKAKKIQRDCELLLGFEEQALGLELMENSSKFLNAAYQKLYKWIQREFKNSNLETPQLNTSMRRALRFLSDRPSLFQSCLEFFTEARERMLFDSFHLALTGEGPSGATDNTVKPIEMAAHDPLRYVGDMLAWTHSATVGEKESLEVLFISEGDELAKGLRAGRESEPWTLVPDEDEVLPEFDPNATLNELVDRNLAGVTRTLHRQVEQAIQTNEDVIPAYKLANLAGFYLDMFSKLLGPKSHLLECLESIESEAMRQFRSLIRDYIATLQSDFQHPTPDLAAPPFLRDALGQLTAIMKIYDTSIDKPEEKEAGFEPILAEALDPFLAGCEGVAQGLGSPSRQVFLTNCKLAVAGVLRPFEFTRSRVKALQESMEGDLESLKDSQLAFLCRGAGLDKIFDAVAPFGTAQEDPRALASLPQLQPDSLVAASQTLDDFLPSALLDAVQNLQSLQDSSLARQLTEEATENFCGKFEHLEKLLGIVDGAADNEVRLCNCLARTSAEIRVLLS
ncbi:related to Conserved oligomeric Golgi complex subunit 6 [Cephalotrichum gorgonifer]|uniref:Conserved oligomeric Golgi complex subunit 6 n=1 Tax=Cephalotrichum gorgonifer TaxID=2041049 RepID=A0AAE8MXX6_9PEZI|nr:related to Conserved oligomeric Golgi complex subunit 6 [Cephalotrichum gorgonifer]